MPTNSGQAANESRDEAPAPVPPWTRVTFRILPPLYALSEATIRLPSRLGTCETKFQIVHSRNSALRGQGAIAVGDHLGTMHNTIVTFTFDTCVEFRGPDGPTSVQWEPLDVAVGLLNVVIEHYRIVVKLHELRRIARRTVQVFGWGWRDEPDPAADGTPRHGIGYFYGPVGLDCDGEDAGVQPAAQETVERLQQLAESGPPALARMIFSDAEAEVLTGNIRSGLTHLYMAFEMVVWAEHERLGRAVVGDEEYERTSALDLEGDEAPPVIFTTVKQCRRWAEGKPSQTQLGKDVRAILKHRNALMHGRDPEVSPADVQEAFRAFTDVVTWLTAAKPTDPATN